MDEDTHQTLRKGLISPPGCQARQGKPWNDKEDGQQRVGDSHIGGEDAVDEVLLG